MHVLESRRYRTGEQVFDEGDAPLEMYMIRSGTVELLKRNSTGTRGAVGVVEAGEIIGAAELLLGRPCMVTARAQTEVFLDVLDPAAWFAMLETESGRRFKPVLTSISEQSRVACARLAELESTRLEEPTTRTRTRHSASVSVSLRARTEEAKVALGGRDRVDVSRFPFRVGRYEQDVQQEVSSGNGLYLRDSEPYHVSRAHFTILLNRRRLYLEDAGSRLGTMVNRKWVGGDPENPTRVPLQPGHNSIHIAGRGSKLTFTLVVKGRASATQKGWRKWLARIRPGRTPNERHH